MKNELEKRSALLSDAGRKMEAALAKLERTDGGIGVPRRRARLIFGLDLTGSREASLYRARQATAAMFDTIRVIGSIAVKLIYYRGSEECRASDWHDDPAVISRMMRSLSCESGYSQIARVLSFALAEHEKLDAVVFIGDQCEEDANQLTSLAASLGKRTIPLFMFHECSDSDQRSLAAKPLFKRMAELSGGVYCEFKPTSAAALQELLSSVAVFSSAGKNGVEKIGPAAALEAQRLRSRLLSLPAPDDPKPGNRW